MSANYPVIVLPLLARTETLDSEDLENIDGRGLHLIIDVRYVVDAPSVIPTIQGKDPASGKYYDILEGEPITITEIGLNVLKVYPGITPKAKVSADDTLPAVWRVHMEHANNDSIIYSVGGNVVN